MTQLELAFGSIGHTREAVRRILSDGLWRSSYDVQHELAALGIHASESSVTARIRDLRKARYGGLTIECKPERAGRWVYRVV